MQRSIKKAATATVLAALCFGGEVSAQTLPDADLTPRLTEATRTATDAAPGQSPSTQQEAAQTTEPSGPVHADGHQLTGKISYYGQAFKGRKTACGTFFDPKQLTMAHKTLPCGTLVRVTNLRNGKSTVVHVTDHGPNVRGRVADLSIAAAAQTGLLHHGISQGKLEVLKMGETTHGRTPKPGHKSGHKLRRKLEGAK
jgi:rare lipoprotein A